MQANYNKQRTPAMFDLPSADVDFLVKLQTFIEREAERRQRVVPSWVAIHVDSVHQCVVESESGCRFEFEGGTSKVEIVGRDAEGEVVIATYLPTYDGPKTEAWNVSLPWGDELSCTFEYDDEECVHVEAKRIVKHKLGEKHAQLTRAGDQFYFKTQQGLLGFVRAYFERLREGHPRIKSTNEASLVEAYSRVVPKEVLSSKTAPRAHLTRTPRLEFFAIDRAYLERLRNGDPATEHQFTVYFERLLDVKLRSRSISPDKVKDLKRETFIRVISAVRRGAVRQPERFGALVNSICNNVLREYYRTVGKNQEMVETRQEIPEMVPDMVLDLEGMMDSGEILVKESLITQDQLQKALEFQRANGGTLASCLTRMGFITDDDITGVLPRQYGVPSINLKDYEIDPKVIKLIPQDTASRYHLIPLSRVGSVLTIAMTDPTNVFAIDDIKFMTGLNVEPVVASEGAIGDAITRFYGSASSNKDQDAQSSERMRMILSGLPARDSALLRAVFSNEKDQDALCREFGVDRDYLRVLLHRAKEKLKSLPASLSEQQEC